MCIQSALKNSNSTFTDKKEKSGVAAYNQYGRHVMSVVAKLGGCNNIWERGKKGFLVIMILLEKNMR
jgi:hypothetical protein